MIDTKELRSAVESAGLNAISGEEVLELIDRLEAAEKERDDVAQQLVQAEIGKREISEAHNAVTRRLSVLADENTALRAKIAEMEKQEPAGYGVRYVEPTNGEEDWDSIWKYRVFAEDHIKDFTQAYADVGEPVGASTVVPLYALPGAQGEKDVCMAETNFRPERRPSA